MPTPTPDAAEDPFHLVTRVARRLKTTWMQWTYPFFAFGKGVTVEFSCDISRPAAPYMSIGNNVYLAADVWLTIVPGGELDVRPKLVLGDRCSVGKRTSISSHNHVVIGEAVLIGPSVVIMDYNHEFSNPESPVRDQGVTEGGRIVIERNCWIGQGAAILAGRGELSIGQNSVIGANAVVTRSCPPHSVMVGNPAKIVRTYNREKREWVRLVEAERSPVLRS